MQSHHTKQEIIHQLPCHLAGVLLIHPGFRKLDENHSRNHAIIMNIQ
jgi:hypothetical protein